MVVDNGCDDQIQGPSFESSFVTVLRSQANLGFGGAVKLANTTVSPLDALCWIPGNGKVSLADCLEWLNRERVEPIYVAKARRSGRPWPEQWKSRLVDAFLTIATGSGWVDVGGTPTAIGPQLRQAFFERAPDGIEIEAFTIAFSNQNGMRMTRTKVPYGVRAFGNSSWRKGPLSELQLLRSFTEVALRRLD